MRVANIASFTVKLADEFIEKVPQKMQAYHMEGKEQVPEEANELFFF